VLTRHWYVLTDLITNGDIGEATGLIQLKRGEYPGTLSSVPLPTSCRIRGGGRNHITESPSSGSETISPTRLNSDGTAYVNPDTDVDDAIFPRVSNLLIDALGQGMVGSHASNGRSGSNPWDWLYVDYCTVQGFEFGLVDSDSEFVITTDTHYIDMGSTALNFDSSRSRAINC
jgi:hypothetical protein